MNNNYITQKMEYNFNYINLPTELFTNPNYSKLSSNAKLLYSLLLNRTKISIKNHFTNKQGHVFIFFTREETATVLNCSKVTATAIFKELVNADLIEEKTQKGKKANIILVKLPLSSQKNEKQIEKNKKAKKTLIDKQKEFLKKINTNIKFREKKLHKLNDIIQDKKLEAFKKDTCTIKNDDLNEVKQQIEYDFFEHNCVNFGVNLGFIDTIVKAISEMKVADKTKINGCYYSFFDLYDYVKNITSCEIIQLIDIIKQTGFDHIKNISSYIKTTLFNIISINQIIY